MKKYLAVIEEYEGYGSGDTFPVIEENNGVLEFIMDNGMFISIAGMGIPEAMEEVGCDTQSELLEHLSSMNGDGENWVQIWEIDDDDDLTKVFGGSDDNE